MAYDGQNRPDLILRGEAFLQGRSKPVAAELRVSDGRMELASGAEPLVAGPLDGLRIEAPVGRAPRRMRLAGGLLFVTEDRDAVAALEGETAWTMLHRLEKFRARLIPFVLVCVAVAWLVWRFALDVLVSAAVALTPASVVDAVGAGTLRTLDFVIAEPSRLDAEKRERAGAIFEKLLAELSPRDRQRHDFRLEFRSTPRVGPNAFALPDGTVVITDQLVNAYDQDDVWAGVLAHEIAHVTEQHGLRQLYRSVGLYVVITFLAGDTVPIVEDILLEGNVLLSLAYSRDAEREADALGLRLTRAAGYQPSGLVMFLRDIGGTGGTQWSWTSSHPGTGERIETIERIIGDR